jgi:hypothetical protein
MKKINLFEIEEDGEYWYLYPSNHRDRIITDRQELIDLAINILYLTDATQNEIEEVQERIKESQNTPGVEL